MKCFDLTQRAKRWRATETDALRLGGRLLRCLIVALMFGTAGIVAGQPPTADGVVDYELENSVKVAYLYGFGRYVHWPESTFAATDNCFVIGVVGEDPTGGMLDKLAQKKKIKNRQIVITRVESVEAAATCHILYVPFSVSQSQQLKMLHSAAGHPILTVGEVSGFLTQGGVVSFFRQGGTLRFSINADAAKGQGVTIDAKLLSLAKTPSR